MDLEDYLTGLLNLASELVSLQSHRVVCGGPIFNWTVVWICLEIFMFSRLVSLKDEARVSE